MDWEEVIQYIDRTATFRSYEEQLAVLMGHPRGYRYCFAVYFCDADICNGGFSQLFHNSTGTMTLVAIEGFERMGRADLADLLRNALFIEMQSGEGRVSGIVPAGFFDGYCPTFETTEEVEDRYYGSLGKDHNGYFAPLIERYIASHPADFD